MKPKDLSAKISDLESLLHHFSFEELTMEEAAYLKSTFNAFKKSIENDNLNVNTDKSEIPNQIKKEILPALEYLIDCSRLLSTGTLTQEQRAYINGMQQISRMLLKKVQKSSSVGSIPSIGVVKELDFNLHHLLHNVLFISKTLIGSPDLKISVDIDKEISEIQKGDPSVLSQMLMHLFGKGIQSMDTGSISIRISLLEETKDISFLEFGLMLKDGDSQNPSSDTRFQTPELLYKSFQKLMEKHNLQSEFVRVSEAEQGMKFVLPFRKADHRTSISQRTYNKPDKFSSVPIAPSSKTDNWDSLLLECRGDLRILKERLDRWQGQLLGFVGSTKVQLKNADFAGLEKSSIETRDNLNGIPFHDIYCLLERMAQTCATDRDLRHLRFLYKSLLEEYGNMDKAIVSELKRLQTEGRL